MIHALIVRFNHYNVALPIAAHAFGFAQIGLGHLPGKHKNALGREFLHAASHIHNEKIVVCVYGHGTRLVELSHTDPAPLVSSFAMNCSFRNVPSF